MPLPLGDWRININGNERDLVVTSVSNEGVVLGSISGTSIINSFTGMWDEAAQEITFMCELLRGGLAPGTIEALFRGYLFSTPTTPQAGQDIAWTLAGSVHFAEQGAPTFLQSSVHSRRNVFGWFAQRRQVI